MSALDFVVPVFLGLNAIQQLLGVVYFMIAVLREFRRQQDPVADDELPPAMVVLKLRGADPYLSDCLRGLIHQDYPRYQVRIMVDSDEDPAWPVVHRVLGESPAEHVEVRSLVAPSEKCSLVCTAMWQATAELPAGCEVVATLDSDVVAHPSWLRELVAPLRDPGVGVSRGLRWFAPPVGKWGAWVRYLWNVVVEITAYYTQMGWGGSLAMKVSILRDTDLRERWLKSANEDVLVGHAMRRLGLKMRWVPSLVMVNREECDLRGCFHFMHRQQIWGRLYNRLGFWSNALGFLLIVATILFGIVRGILAGLDGAWLAAAANLLAVAGFFGVQALMVVLLEGLVRRLLARHGREGARLQVKTFLAIVLSQFWSAYVLCRSMAASRYVWRGVEYEVHGPWNVRMQYRPYTGGNEAGGAKTVTAPSASTPFDSI